MTTTNYVNAAIYNHNQQKFIFNQHMIVDENTGKIIEAGNGRTTRQVCDDVVDLNGRFVMPGIMNAHTHITDMPTYWWHNGEEKRHPDSREVCTMFAIRNMQDALSHGITYMRNVGAEFDIDVEIKKMQEKGWIKGPKIMTSGRAFSITGGHDSESTYEVDGIDEVRKGVRQALKNGVDNIKMMVTGGVLKNGETPDDIQFTLEEARTAVSEAHHKGKTAAAHAQGNAGIKEAVAAGFDTIEHAFDIDDEAITMMKEHGTIIVPTMNAMFAIYKYGRGVVPDWAREKVILNIKKHFMSIAKAAKAGIPIAMGTDAGTPFNGFQNESAYEMQLYVEKAAMTPAQAIDAATINCAKAMHIDQEYGQIAAGNYADFLVMNENPIDDISVVGHDKDVYQNGKRVHAQEVVNELKATQKIKKISAAI
ncbi:MAG: amidohydrolase family protein [Lentilactobacillus hilgardii]|uniref:Amidohydrolase family protein n=1 Tax=Lentilactobacillus hilgardii TaxID=1588 RepID=A0A6P1E849_LENHI|nr:amidohydrolase family protein [Lentilactobacillus hilgardii]RRG08308.1 MAG: amidohydrolase family protein [Lactobacillus sp.]EEI72271.1 amidohydrolase family protein [Lentilactobacillus hilgardii ATCC 27305]MBZ2201778.1 amidohydrolase family protein [Lentilactobacillus hilgardii]MBZ2204677.1 amidohydrolase family protein [Lentilactobacillus hilgardii]MCT3392976.1 amidohydrolase family protein [Lentilactobacillus hilgardii]